MHERHEPHQAHKQRPLDWLAFIYTLELSSTHSVPVSKMVVCFVVSFLLSLVLEWWCLKVVSYPQRAKLFFRVAASRSVPAAN